MNESTIEKAALQFGKGNFKHEKLGNGLIHRSYKVSFASGETIVLQCINSTAFKQPENIVHNYHLLYNFLREKGGSIQIPRPLNTLSGKQFWVDGESNTWRATQFSPNSYSPSVADNIENVYATAKAFASLTNELVAFDTDALHVIIPKFHDLAYRYQQFEEAITKAPIKLLLKATHVISELRDRKKLVEFYITVASSTEYPSRVMHHDAKISNVLFDKTTDAVRGAIDLDTIMPGKYFSDAGDMIRTMACTEEENSTAWEKIDIKPAFYEAIISGYLAGMGDNLTEAEKKNIHASGLMMIYMQCLRFVTDFLKNDIYYQTTYPEQNLNRALNQLILLEKLEEFLQQKEFVI